MERRPKKSHPEDPRGVLACSFSHAHRDNAHSRQAMVSATAVIRVKREELEDGAARAEALKPAIDATTA
jgi:hypothetical protein